MRNPLIFILLVAASLPAYAQPWMPQTGGRVKFDDVVAQYERIEEEEEEKEEKRGKIVEEDENYHFDRWQWYWKQHLDADGYIVSGRKKADEWKTYRGGVVASKTTATDNWIFQGPSTSNSGYSGLGRINVVGFDPVDSNTFYAGSAGGGTWKTTDGGTTWTCLYDVIGSLGVSDIQVNPLNRNTLYVATGDRDASDTYSTGIIKSYDGGASWIALGPSWTLDSFRIVRSLLLNPLDTNKITIGTANGLYRSYDAGATWIRTATQNFRQVLYCPVDTGVLYASRDGGGSSQIMRSLDGGYTWATVTAFTGSQRINLAVSPAAGHIVRAIVSNNSSGLKGIYNSFDYGETYIDAMIGDAACSNNLLGYDITWPTTACNGQGWYDLCIAVDPVNADNVIIGGVNNYYSTDGGLTWDLANQWHGGGADLEIVHADKHFLGYNPLNGAIFLGCDGGIYKNYSPLGGPWTDLTNGIGVTQFYRNAVDNGVTFCLGGAQDNGSKMVDGTTYTDLTGGDGMQCLINYSDPENVFYCAYQNGYVDMTINGGASFSSITGDLPTPGAWITPYVLHPSHPYTMFIGYKQVFASDNYGASWGPISPVFSTSNNILILTVALSNPDYIYAVRDYGSKSMIHYTSNYGTTWDTISTPFPNYIYVSDLVVDPKDATHFWITASGFGAPKVYSYTTTTGVWVNESAGLPNMPVNCMVIDSFSQTKYVGNDVAVFYKTLEMSSWALYNNHLPGVEIFDLNINHTTNELWAATYGRGMWKSKKAELTPAPPSKTGAVVLETEQIKISPNPCHDVFTISSTSVPFRNANVNIRLVTVDGKTVQASTGTFDTGGKLKVSISSLPAGIYFCEVANDKGVAKSKVVVY